MSTVKFSIVQHSHDAFPRQFEMDWADLAGRLARHDAGDKDGTALICSTFNGARSSKTLGERWLIGLDIETNPRSGQVPPPPEMIAQYLAIKRVAAVLWTTHGHTPEQPRYRLVLPLDKPFKPLEIGSTVERMMSEIVAANSELIGCYDVGKLGGASIFYLARHPPGNADYWSRVVEGDPQSTDELLAVSRMVCIGVQMKQAQRDALRKSREFSPELKQLIDAFNDSHELPDLFGQYGYRHIGGRWKSAYQSPGSQAATAIFPDHTGAFTWSESDAAAGIGTDTGDGGRFFDAFALYMHYEHGNNFRAAINALRDRYGPREGQQG